MTVGDDLLGLAVLLQHLAKEFRGSLFVSSLGDIDFWNFAFMVHRMPQTVRLSADFHEYLIEMPPPMAEAVHLRCSLPSNGKHKYRTEAVPPKTNGLVTSAIASLEVQILDVSKREREANIQQACHLDGYR